jgi:hypothetical protein
MVGVNGWVLFSMDVGNWGIWRTDGTLEHTGPLVGNSVVGVMSSPVVVADQVVFTALAGNDYGIWVTGATLDGTKRLTEPGSYLYPSWPSCYMLLGDTLLFRKRDQLRDEELWALDLDGDNDGLLAWADNCPEVSNGDQADADGDGVGDVCDACPNTVPGARVDAMGCPPVMRGDFDRDGDVDGSDVQTFVACLSGPAVAPGPACAGMDFEPDGDVDMVDFGVLQCCVSGVNRPAKVGG